MNFVVADFVGRSLLLERTIFGLMEPLKRLRSLLTLGILLVGVFENMLLMRVTSVASVTEQNDFFLLFDESYYYEVYSNRLHCHSPYYTPSRSLSYTPYQQNRVKRISRRVRSTFPKRNVPK